MRAKYRPHGWQSMSFDELLAIGLCECGLWFEEHPRLPKFDQRTWMSAREQTMPWRNTITGKVMTRRQATAMGVDQSRRAGLEGRRCQYPSCGQLIPDTRAVHAKYCSERCMQRAAQAAWRSRRPRRRELVA